MRYAIEVIAFTGAVALAVGCGPDESNNGTTTNNGTNNGTTTNNSNNESNNGTNNETVANNGTNNGTSNNGTSNNNGTTGTNNGTTLMGDCVREQDDTNGDGTYNRAGVHVLDQEGNRIRTYLDFDGDGTVDTIFESDHSPEGLVEQRIDEDADGAYDLAVYIEYHASGKSSSVRWDRGVDGTYEYEQLHTYDADGQRTSYTRDGRVQGGRLVEDADGQLDYRRVTTWAGLDQMTSQEFDTDGDGTFDATVEITRDNDGNAVEITFDGRVDPYALGQGGQLRPDPPLLSQGDGSADVRAFDRTFDAAGNLVSQRWDGRFATDGSIVTVAGQEPIATEVYERDGEGNVVAHRLDVDEDGTDDFVVTFEFNANNEFTLREVDGVLDNDQALVEPADGTIDEVIRRQFDGELLTGFQRDWGDDGVDEMIAEFEYDADGNPTLRRVDGDSPTRDWEFPMNVADGVWDYELVFAYDDQGRETELTYDQNGNTTFHRLTTYDACSAFADFIP